MENKKLILEDRQGLGVRTIRMRAPTGVAVFRTDKRRVEVWGDESYGVDHKIPFEKISDIKLGTDLSLGDFGRLRFVDFIESTVEDPAPRKENSRLWWMILAVFVVLVSGSLIALHNLMPEHVVNEEEKMEQVVQIVKKIELQKPKPVAPAPTMSSQQKPVEPEAVKPRDVAKNVRRMGALGVLGSLKGGKQKGGLNLGAVQTSAGPGLGGNAGSGGVQTSLYAKGIISAPVGAGGNIQGAGGYGTKGKGGGQAGYGSLSLIGSAGTSSIPLGQEAIIEGGLDRDLIAQVVQRNMGQIRFCYEQGLQLEPGLAGRVVADWTINAQGVVTSPGIGGTTLNSKAVEDCILLRLRSWKFPLPQGGVSVKVSYPFVLKRVGS